MKVGIIGANGYSGIELIRFLLQHPYTSIEIIVANSNSGKEIQELFPHLTNLFEMELKQLNIDEISSRVDLLFFATPSGISKDLIPSFLERGIKCIDISGDFRLKDPDLYETWYNFTHSNPNMLEEAAYGLADVYNENLAHSSLIANPGCYATAALLGLVPIIKHNVIDPGTIIIDGKSGVSGAGRKTSIATHYSEVNENVKAYKVGAHQHIPEIEQVLTEINGEKVNISFTTHLIPMTRGILTTIYASLKENLTSEQLHKLYEKFSSHSPFVRIRPIGNIPATKEVYGSNYCDIGFVIEERTERVMIFSVIDNVVKGAAGQAIQNMNIVNGWDMETGLRFTPTYP